MIETKTKPNKNGKKRGNDGRFLPGNPGGPGRPKGSTSIKDVLRRIGEEPFDLTGENMPKLEAVLRTVFEHALNGKPWAIHFIADRLEGKAPQTVNTREFEKDKLIVIN